MTAKFNDNVANELTKESVDFGLVQLLQLACDLSDTITEEIEEGAEVSQEIAIANQSFLLKLEEINKLMGEEDGVH